MRSLVVLVAAAAPAYADLPKKPSGITVRANGVLAIEKESPRLFAIEGDSARDVAHPDVGNLGSIEGSWILGRTGLLHEVDGAWKRIELPPLPAPQAPFREGHVVAISAERVAVVRYLDGDHKEGGSVIDLVDANGGVTPLLTISKMYLSRPAPDARGGFWTVVAQNPDSYTGYAHWTPNGEWTLFRQTMSKTSSYVTELPPMSVVDVNANVSLVELSASADGGALARVSYNQLATITPDGKVAELASDNTTVSKVCAIVPEGTGHVVVMAGYGDTMTVTTVDDKARIGARIELPLPAWYAKAHFKPSVYDCAASAERGQLWIVSGPFLFERTAAGFVAHVNPDVIKEVADDNRPEHASLAVVTIPPLAGLGIGTLVGGRIDDERHYRAAGLETLAGAAGGMPGALLLDVLDEDECTEGGDYKLYNDVACGFRKAGYLVGIAGGGALGGLGTYLVGREYDELPSKKDAYAGAFVGGSAGAALSLVSTRLLRRYTNAGRMTRTVIASMMIGAGSTIGYQLAR